MSDSSSFDRLLSKARLASGLSVRNLAARTGISYPHISLIERGLRQPSRKTVTALIAGLDLDAASAYRSAGYADSDFPTVPPQAVPIYASIPAGNPKEVDEAPEEAGYIPLGEVRGNALYYVRVAGESLRNAGFASGDLVLIDASKREPRTGQLVVARVGTDSMLRFWHPGKRVAVLRSANEEYPDILVRDVEVLGIAVGHFERL